MMMKFGPPRQVSARVAMSSQRCISSSWRLGLLFLSLLLSVRPVWAGHPLGAPPGVMVDVGGYHLHLYCEGEGSPVVLLDAGLGGGSLEWLPVMAEVSRFTKVCAYDRAGYGWSEMGPLPRTSSMIVNELYLLLQGARLAGPFLLVGHSYGGYNMQLFARRYPYLSAGLVLVDSSHPYQVERFEAPPFNLVTAPTSSWGMVQFRDAPKLNAKLPRAARLLAMFQFANWRPRRTLSNELLGFRDSEREVRAEQPLEPMPVVVVSRGKRVWPAGAQGDRLEHLWLGMQTELAAQSPWSAHILARRSAHQIHLEQPDVVAYAIALVSDCYRTAHSEANGAPHARTDEHMHIGLRDASWLKDSLDMDPSHKVLVLYGDSIPIVK